ncbi:MAG: AAA family ATPase [Planctomycetes bacterium]|nr:AAA family ATPase [Planctomycetota bacterium]
MSLLHIAPLPRQVTKAQLLGFFNLVPRMDRQRVGRIDLRGGEAIIEIPDGWQVRLVQALDGQRLGHRRVRVWVESQGDGSTADGCHFEHLARLLEMESRAEAAKAAERNRRLSPAAAERTGLSLVDLVITDEDTGLGGRYIVQLAKRTRGPLPWTRLGVGSPVVLSADSAKGGKSTGQHRGVVCERTQEFLRVALAGRPDSGSDELTEHDTWRVSLSSDEVAMQRQQAALQRAQVARGERLAELRDIFLGQREPEFDREQDEPTLDAGLNHTQQQAVRFSLAARDVALIHGPPGTGKTTTVVELIRQVIRRGDKVLACAPSNLAVDNIFERLLAKGERAVRLGHPARVTADLRDHTLDLLVQTHPDVKLARKLVKEAMGLFRRAGRHTRSRPVPGSRQETRQEAKNLLADARRLEAQAVDQILDNADVLCATTTALNHDVLGRRRFDLGVIDEACQSTEPGCWMPLLWCDKMVLSGDHCQLPPTVVSSEATAQGLGVSLFERLMNHFNGSIARPLTVQYRMHKAIMDFPSEEFYESRLQAHASVSDHLLTDLQGVAVNNSTGVPMEFIDTAGASYDEEIEPDGESRLNQQEATLICRKVQGLLDSGVAPGDIAVIAAYAAQVRLLRERLSVSGLEIDSVDGFQGREKEVVVISLVRSNAQAEIGFLQETRRMNVAMTRARRKLLVVGDSATLCVHPFYRRMIDTFETLGGYRTVWEEDDMP